MLNFASTDSAPLEIWVTITQPMVYLDHCVLAGLAVDSTGRGRQFREVLERAEGTLFLSWAHIVELFALGAGPTFERVAAYLKTFGGRFAIIDADPHAVIGREKNWKQGRQNPALDEDFMRLLAKNWDGKSEMSLGILLDAIVKETEFFERIKVLHREQKANLKLLFDQQRERYRVERGAKQLLDNAQYPYSPPAFMTEKVCMELMRECVRTNEQFNPSDGLDFYHAVVSISYCTHAVFDKKWARRCGNVGLPEAAASVFDGTQMDELIAALNSCPKIPK
jgi:hypothetical protein